MTYGSELDAVLPVREQKLRPNDCWVLYQIMFHKQRYPATLIIEDYNSGYILSENVTPEHVTVAGLYDFLGSTMITSGVRPLQLFIGDIPGHIASLLARDSSGLPGSLVPPIHVLKPRPGMLYQQRGRLHNRNHQKWLNRLPMDDVEDFARMLHEYIEHLNRTSQPRRGKAPVDVWLDAPVQNTPLLHQIVPYITSLKTVQEETVPRDWGFLFQGQAWEPMMQDNPHTYEYWIRAIAQEAPVAYCAVQAEDGWRVEICCGNEWVQAIPKPQNVHLV